MSFSFDGEYSVVADPSDGSVDSVVHGVLSPIQKALRIQFCQAGAFKGHENTDMGPESLVISRFKCLYDIETPLHSSVSQLPPIMRTMAGELDISVAWDRRHKYLPGRKVAVHFSLIGR